jgi:hypothetical protein
MVQPVSCSDDNAERHGEQQPKQQGGHGVARVAPADPVGYQHRGRCSSAPGGLLWIGAMFRLNFLV